MCWCAGLFLHGFVVAWFRTYSMLRITCLAFMRVLRIMVMFDCLCACVCLRCVCYSIDCVACVILLFGLLGLRCHLANQVFVWFHSCIWYMHNTHLWCFVSSSPDSCYHLDHRSSFFTLCSRPPWSAASWRSWCANAVQRFNIYIYIYICRERDIDIYIYIYIERER